jgi:dihydroneopterin aldolase
VDKIFLRGLEIDAVIGIWEWEQRIKQRVRVDLEIETDARKAAAVDSIEAARDYKVMAKRLISFTEESRYQLVETLAEALAELLVKEFAVSWLRLSVAKPGAIEGSKEVGVAIERSAADYG